MILKVSDMISSIHNQDSAIYAKTYSDLFDFLNSNDETEVNKRLLIDSCAKEVVVLCNELQTKEGFSLSNALKVFISNFQTVFDKKSNPIQGSNSEGTFNMGSGSSSGSSSSGRRNSDESERPSSYRPSSGSSSPERTNFDDSGRISPAISDIHSSSTPLIPARSVTRSDPLSRARHSPDREDLNLSRNSSNNTVDISDAATETVSMPIRIKVPESINRFNTRNNQVFELLLTSFNSYFSRDIIPEEFLVIEFNKKFDDIYQELKYHLESVHKKISSSDSTNRETRKNSLIFDSFEEFMNKCLDIYTILVYFIKLVDNYENKNLYTINISRIEDIYGKYQHYIMLNKIFFDKPETLFTMYNENFKSIIEKTKIEKRLKDNTAPDSYDPLNLIKVVLELKILRKNNDFLKKKMQIKENDSSDLLKELPIPDTRFDRFLHIFKFSQYYALESVRFKCDPDYEKIELTEDTKQIRYKNAAIYRSAKFIDRFNLIRNLNIDSYVLNDDDDKIVFALVSIDKNKEFAEKYMENYSKYSLGNEEKIVILLKSEISTYGEINDFSPQSIFEFVDDKLKFFREISRTYLENSEPYAFHFVLSRLQNAGKEIDENKMKINLSELGGIEILPLFKTFFIKANEEDPEKFSKIYIKPLRRLTKFMDFFKLISKSVENYKIFFTSLIDSYIPIVNRLYYGKEIFNLKFVRDKLGELIHLMILFGMLDLSFQIPPNLERPNQKYILVDLNNIIGNNYPNKWNNKDIISKIFDIVYKNKTRISSLLETQNDREILNASFIRGLNIIKAEELDHSKRSIFYPIIYVYVKYILNFRSISNSSKAIIMVDSSKNSLPEKYSSIFSVYSPLFTVATPGVTDSVFKDVIEYDIKSIGYLIFLSRILGESFVLTYRDHEYYTGIAVRKIEEQEINRS